MPDATRDIAYDSSVLDVMLNMGIENFTVKQHYWSRRKRPGDTWADAHFPHPIRGRPLGVKAVSLWHACQIEEAWMNWPATIGVDCYEYPYKVGGKFVLFIWYKGRTHARRS